MKAVMSAAVGFSMLLLGSGTTWAADMCFLDEEGGGVIRGKNFSFPGAGACKAFQGYISGSPSALISGSACGTSDNVDIRFNLNYSTPDGHFGVSVFRIDRLHHDLSQAGFGYYTSAHAGNGGGWASAQFHVKTIPCPPMPVQ